MENYNIDSIEINDLDLCRLCENLSDSNNLIDNALVENCQTQYIFYTIEV